MLPLDSSSISNITLLLFHTMWKLTCWSWIVIFTNTLIITLAGAWPVEGNERPKDDLSQSCPWLSLDADTEVWPVAGLQARELKKVLPENLICFSQVKNKNQRSVSASCHVPGGALELWWGWCASHLPEDIPGLPGVELTCGLSTTHDDRMRQIPNPSPLP